MKTASLIFTLLISIWYVLTTIGAYGLETCTMGDTDGYIAPLIVAFPLLIAGNIIVLIQEPESITQKYIGVIALIIPSSVLIIVIPWIIDTTLGGHHLCGETYDGYLTEYDNWIRYIIPLAHIAIILFSLLTAYKYLQRNITIE